MLSIADIKSSAGATRYFFEVDNYYLGSHSVAPATWWGKGAERLGLAGKGVDRDTFARLLNGEFGGAQIPRGPGGKHRAAFDLTFSAPKSVSLLGLVARREEVVVAHRRAVEVALGTLQSHGVQVRVKERGVIRREATDNLAVALLTHDTSRELDPQLHTHAVAMNATQRADGAWRSIDRTAAYRHKMLLGAIYRSELARELRGMGYEIEKTHDDGRFEVVGFTPEQQQHFSRRRQDIEAKAKHIDEPTAAEMKVITRESRAKKTEVDRGALHERWTAECRELRVVFPTPVGPELAPGGPARPATERIPKRAGASAERDVRWAIDHLMEREAVVGRSELLQATLKHSFARLSTAAIEAAIDLHVERGELLAAASPDPTVVGSHYTSPEALALEREVVGRMLDGRGAVPPVLTPAAVAEHLGTEATRQALGGKTLNEEQRAAVEMVLTTPDRYVGIQGWPGTGKTTGLTAVRLLAEQQGMKVRGLSATAAAALVLSAESGIESTTLESHLLDGERGMEDGAPRGPDLGRELWVVDEVSMMSTRDAGRLFGLAEAREARVVLVGDREQLPSVGSGRIFGLLADRGLEISHLRDIRRQQNPELRKAVYQTLYRDHAGSVATLSARISKIKDTQERLEAVAGEYLGLSATDRQSTLVLTSTNKVRRVLNEMIREGLREQGALTGSEQSSCILARRDFTDAQKRESQYFRPGNKVLFLRAYRSLGVDKHAYCTVESVDRKSNTIMLRSPAGTSIAWQPHRAGGSAPYKISVYEVQGRQLAVGDRIRWTQNERGLRRRNGEYAVVRALDRQGATASIEWGDGRQDPIALGVGADDSERHWDHGYAITVYASQGRTEHRAIANVESYNEFLVGHEAWAVALSRNRHDVRVFTDDVEALPIAIARNMEKTSAVEGVEGVEHAARVEREITEAKSRASAEPENVKDHLGQPVARAAHDTEASAERAVADGWAAAVASDNAGRAAMLTATRAQAERLNAAARKWLRDSGRLSEDARRVDTAYGEREFAAGDVLVFRRTVRGLGVKRGQFGVIRAFDGDFALVDLAGSDAQPRNKPALRIDLGLYKNVDHGYALPAATASGCEVDTAFVLASTRFDAEVARVALGCHRQETRVHWSREEFRDESALRQAFARPPDEDLSPEFMGPAALKRCIGSLSCLARRTVEAKAGDAGSSGQPASTGVESLRERQSRFQVAYDTRRQKHRWMRQATRAVDQGDVAAAIQELRVAGGVVEHATDRALEGDVVDRARQAIATGNETVIVVTGSDRETQTLNRRVRDALRAGGALGAEGTIDTEHGAIPMAVGDQVVFRRSHRTLGVVTAVSDVPSRTGRDEPSPILGVRLASGRDVRVDLRAEASRHIDHGYAVPAYRAGAVEVDRAIVVAGTAMHREALRTAVSRGARGVEVHWSAGTFRNERAMVEALGRGRGAKITPEQMGNEQLRRHIWWLERVVDQGEMGRANLTGARRAAIERGDVQREAAQAELARVREALKARGKDVQPATKAMHGPQAEKNPTPRGPELRLVV